MSEDRESEVWLQAAQEVLTQIGVALHYTDIKRFVLEQNLVGPGLNTTLEAALFGEVQKPDSRFRLVDGQAGVFALATAPPVVRLVQPPVQGQVKVKSRPSLTSQASCSRYVGKYRRLKRYVKQQIFTNAAICDEVIKLEEKIARVKEERRFLLRKLVQQQAVSDVLAQVLKQQSPGSLGGSGITPLTLKPTSQSVAQLLGVAEKKKKKVTTATPATKKKTTRELLEESVKAKSSTKKAKQMKKVVQPIPLDKLGRPVFPIELGPLTVYCLGEITADRPGYHCPDYIYPVGFCSTRPYANLNDPTQKCLYTCKISEGIDGPEFEISPEDSPDQVLSGQSAVHCHQELLKLINQTSGAEILPSQSDKGAEFFGFCHPVIQNLIQSMPGARKCSRYKWVKFEVKKEGQLYVDTDVAVSYDSLTNMPVYQNLIVARHKQLPKEEMDTDASKNLRNLLSSTAAASSSLSVSSSGGMH